MPTAEGAIQLAMEELPITLHGARVLVIGYGRLGRVLADRLAGLKARVSVAARRYADLAWAENCGYGVEHPASWRAGCAAMIRWSIPSLSAFCGRRSWQI